MGHQNTRVLLITPDNDGGYRTEMLLSEARPPIAVTRTDNVSHALDFVAANAPDIVLVDHTLVATLGRIHELAPNSPLIVIGGEDADATSEEAAHSTQNIVFDSLDAAHVDRYNLTRAIRHALERKVFDDTTRQLHELQLIHTMSKVINGNLDLRLKLGIVLEQVINLLGIDAADILLLDARNKIFHYSVGRGFNAPALMFNSAPLTQGYASRVASELRLVIINNPDCGAAPTSTFESGMIADEGFVTYLGMPLIAKGQLHGVIGMFKRSLFEPDAVWTGFVDTFARQAAGAIATTLFENSMRSKLDTEPYYEGGIEEWARAIDRANKESPGHSRRVADFSVRLGRTIGMSEEDLLHMYQGALLHDIGKMGIPDDVLLKPGPLTAEEWALMRRHPLYAYHMLARIDYLQTALDIPYLHHEHWDGTGYPLGLSGEDIPLAARVFAVADVWDALCSDRPFRKAWTLRQAYELINQESGSYFDPTLVAAFQRLISATVS
jgi:HD-GYP domain-containing protein (c-di-GMP phosphodiesterase class II)